VSAKRREDRVVAAAANDCWSMDVLSDQLPDGRKIRVLTIVDNGPEFISKDLDLWAWLHGVEIDFSRPGKPTDNAFAESFNGKFRAECPNTYWFLSLDATPG
jgi:putative transposase